MQLASCFACWQKEGIQAQHCKELKFVVCLQDLPPLDTAALWQHFIMYGQHEGRPFRYSCTPKVMTGLEAFAAGQKLQTSTAVAEPVAVAAGNVAAASATPALGMPARQLLELQDEFLAMGKPVMTSTYLAECCC